MDDETAGQTRATALIEGARRGDARTIDELIGLVYPELKRRARWLMMGERPGHTFGPSGSELVQRVMEKILEVGGQIFSAAQTEEDLINMLTRRMRYILVDYARAAVAHGKPSPKGRVQFENVERWAPAAAVNIDEVIGMDEVLTKLAARDPDAAKALELRFFAGLTNEEAAGAVGLSVASFRRNLKRATVFVKAAMEGRAPSK
jgi:RNA polymerase sigma factor (TIGR02999 family)